ncbi:MAG: hypothetical protein OXC27_15155, partial [Caldilineaceae bacterium]|nr:hypothetical protein [Caldilineaceae bacterium]
IGACKTKVFSRGYEMCLRERFCYHLRAAVMTGVVDDRDIHGQPVFALPGRGIDALQAAAQKIAHVVRDDNNF